MELLEFEICCPYCWQSQLLLVDDSVVEQRYVEDCQICCQPMMIVIDLDARPPLEVYREND